MWLDWETHLFKVLGWDNPFQTVGLEKNLLDTLWQRKQKNSEHTQPMFTMNTGIEYNIDPTMFQN